jgi:signal transduction histidine kinase
MFCKASPVKKAQSAQLGPMTEVETITKLIRVKVFSRKNFRSSTPDFFNSSCTIKDMNPVALFLRYQELQRYVGWTVDDAEQVQALAPHLEAHLSPLIDDFYTEIERHPEARKVITGGDEQIQRLKGTLLGWLRDLVSGSYDSAYVAKRWRVGWRHVEIGLDQVFTNVALSRMRRGLLCALEDDERVSHAMRRSLNTLLDLDLAIIEDAYQTEYMLRQQRSERLAALGHVAGGVAHELRNPLNVVKTSVYFLRNARNASPEKRAEHLERIERHVVLADSVITALTSFARMPVPNLKPFALLPCIQDCLEVSALPATIQVTVDLPPGLPDVVADKDQLGIVLSNLIRNAREAMGQGGTLSITGRSDKNSVDVAVVDTGTGIPPDQLSQIMEPLYSTKARGLGLGLAISRAILDKNKGSLRVQSEVGKGSTFTLRLLAFER